MVKGTNRTPAIQRIPVQSTGDERRHAIRSYRIRTNVELETLLQQTIRDDPQVRKGAFEGIQDHINVRRFLSDSFKNNETAIFEKLCRGIIDTDSGVREAAYETLVKVKRCENFGNYIPTLLVPSVLEALAHSEMDIHLLGRKATDMILTQIPSSFYLFVRKISESLEDMMKKDVYEQPCSNVHLLRIFQSLNVCLSSMPCMPDIGETCEIFFDKKSLEVLKNVLSIFPRSWNQHSNVVGDSKHFDIDIEVTRIFFRLPTLSDSEKFLAFICYALHKITESNVEDLLTFFPPYVPELLPDLQSHSQANLIQAFTAGFKLSRPESKFKSACVTAVKEMMLGSITEDENSELFDKCNREWIEELCKMLPLLGHENKCASQDVLRTLLKASTYTRMFKGVEKSLLHQLFCWLFTVSDEGPYNCDSLFYRIPREMQERCLMLLEYIPVLDEHLLKSMARDCVRQNMKCLREMVSAVDGYYRSRKHEQADGLFLFFSLLVSENEDYEEDYEEDDEEDDYEGNSITTLLDKSDTEYMDIILPKLSYNAAELSRFLSVSNHHRSQYVLLRLVAQLDSHLEKSSPEFVASLSNVTFDYMIEVTYLGENRIDARDHCLSPCFTLLRWNTKFLGLILDEIIKYVEAQCNHECLDKIIAVTKLVALIHEEGCPRIILPCQDKFDTIKSSLISFKYHVDENFERLAVKSYHNLCVALQQLAMTY